MMGFKPTPPRWADGARALHAILVWGGLSPEEAVKLNPHSFRHLMLSAARQLGMPGEEADEMGHWGCRSPSYERPLC